MASIVLAHINFYPIKSCRGISLESAELDDRGIRFDRRWMVVDSTGRFLTQREWPTLALVTAEVTAESMIISAPGMNSLAVSIAGAGRSTIPTIVWNDAVSARDEGDEAAGWFSGYLHAPVRLVYMPDDAQRRAERGGYSGKVGFADAYPILLMAESSVADLNTRLDVPVPMNRFRPNFVVTGSMPYDEDEWREIVIGGFRFHCVKPCARCAITTVDQQTGKKGKEPLQTLSRYRNVDGNVLFGMNVIHEARGIIRVGSPVSIVEKR